MTQRTQHPEAMTWGEYDEGVMRTWQCDRGKSNRILNALLGMVGEAGEVAELIKKDYYHDIRALTWYQGQIYLLDGCEQVLRRLDPNTGAVVTIAGTRTPDTGVTQSPPYTCTAGFNCVSNPPMTLAWSK